MGIRVARLWYTLNDSANLSGNHDYSSLSTSLTFLPGDTVGSAPRCVTINILDDNVVENEEEFTVALSSSSVIQPTNTTAINVTIYEDPSDCKSIGIVQNSYLVCWNNFFTLR